MMLWKLELRDAHCGAPGSGSALLGVGGCVLKDGSGKRIMWKNSINVRAWLLLQFLRRHLGQDQRGQGQNQRAYGCFPRVGRHACLRNSCRSHIRLLCVAWYYRIGHVHFHDYLRGLLFAVLPFARQCFSSLTRAQLPFLFGCIPACVVCADKMGFVMQNFIVKGFLFIGLGIVSHSLKISTRVPVSSCVHSRRSARLNIFR